MDTISEWLYCCSLTQYANWTNNNTQDNTNITTKSNNTSRCSWLNVAIDIIIKIGFRTRLAIGLTSGLPTAPPTTYS
eukprot:581782-Lingulodinium_polyedra.AAC.1